MTGAATWNSADRAEFWSVAQPCFHLHYSTPDSRYTCSTIPSHHKSSSTHLISNRTALMDFFTAQRFIVLVFSLSFLFARVVLN